MAIAHTSAQRNKEDPSSPTSFLIILAALVIYADLSFNRLVTLREPGRHGH
jgi:hypothetical protein